MKKNVLQNTEVILSHLSHVMRISSTLSTDELLTVSAQVEWLRAGLQWKLGQRLRAGQDKPSGEFPKITIGGAR